MSLIVPAFANVDNISVVATKQIATFSKGAYRTYRFGTFNNVPNQPILLADTPAGSAMVQSGVFSASADSTIGIDAYGGYPVFYEIGVDAVVKEGRLPNGIQVTPGVLNATGALTAAMIYTGMVTSTTAAAVTATVPTGAVMDASGTWAVNEYLDWVIINTGPDTFTVTAAASGHTIVGGNGAVFAVPTLTSCYARTRKTAADTFVTYASARPIS